MATLNLLVAVNAYSDQKPNNNPSLSDIKRTRDITGLTVENPGSQSYTIPAAGSISISFKSFIYIEAMGPILVAINGGDAFRVNPFVVSTKLFPGLFMTHTDIESIVISNPSSDDEVSLYVATAE